MQNRFIVGILGCALITGCASEQKWYNPGKTSDESRRDYQECKNEAEESGKMTFRNTSVYDVVKAQKIIDSVFAQCMIQRGYTNKDGDKTKAEDSKP